MRPETIKLLAENMGSKTTWHWSGNEIFGFDTDTIGNNKNIQVGLHCYFSIKLDGINGQFRTLYNW